MPQRVEVPGHGIVEFPDGMSDDAMAAAIKKNLLVGKTPQAPVPMNPVEGMKKQYPSNLLNRKPIDSLAGGVDPVLNAGIGSGMTDLWQGIQQRFGMVTPQQVDEKRTLDKPLLATGAGKAGNIFGQVAPLAAVGALAPQATGFLGNIGQGAIQGVLQGGVTPTGTGESALRNTALGGGVGALGGLAGASLGKLISPNTIPSPERTKVLQEAKGLGYRIPIGQQTGNVALKNIDETLKVLPATQGKMASMAENNQGIVNRTIAEGIGEGGGNLSEGALRAAHDRLSKEFQRLSKGAKLDTSTPEFAASIDKVKAEIAQLDPKAAKQVIGKVQPYITMLEKWKQAGSVSGEVYQANRTFLSKAANADKGGPLGHYLKELLKTADSATPNTPEWQAVRQQYSLLKTLEQGKAPAVSVEGDVSALKLASGLRGRDSKAYLTGGFGESGKAAKIGEMFRVDIPNSGTPQRQFWINALTNPLSLGGSFGATGAGLGYASAGPDRSLVDALKGGAVGAGIGVLGPKAIQGLLYDPRVQSYILQGGLGPGAAQMLRGALSPTAAAVGVLRDKNR